MPRSGSCRRHPDRLDPPCQAVARRHPPLGYGFHTITAEATTTDGRTVTATTTFEHIDFDESQLVVEIITPGDEERVTCPTPVIGAVDRSRLAFYTLEIELVPSSGGPRSLLASGSTPLTEEVLGNLDPTPGWRHRGAVGGVRDGRTRFPTCKRSGSRLCWSIRR